MAEGPVGWQGLLRVVDFQDLLSSQPIIAQALDRAQRAGGTLSPTTKGLREGYQLLAKTLWTRRASIRRVHDLAWLDHTVVSAATRLGRIWEGDEGQAAIAAAEASTPDGVLRELLPLKGSDWVEMPVQAYSGISPNVKLERGVSGPFRVGIVPEARARLLADAAATAKFHASPEAITVLGEIEALSAAARRAGTPSVAVVFAASSFEDRPAE